jgi:hypothetical protein
MSQQNLKWLFMIESTTEKASNYLHRVLYNKTFYGSNIAVS